MGAIYRNGIYYGGKSTNGTTNYNELENIPLSLDENNEVQVNQNYETFFEKLGIETKEITQEEYDNLSEEDKNNEKIIYFISNGVSEDSEIKLENYYTKEEVNNLIPTDFYTKEEVDNLIPTDFYTKEEVDNLVDYEYLTFSTNKRDEGTLQIVIPYSKYRLFSIGFFVKPSDASTSGPPLKDYNIGQNVFTTAHLYYVAKSTVVNVTRMLAYDPQKNETFVINSPVTYNTEDNTTTLTIPMPTISSHLPENMETFYAYVTCISKNGGN